MFGLAAEIGDNKIDLLAQYALGRLGRDLLDQVIARIEVLNGKLHAFELILALNGVGARTRNGGADRDRVALRAGRPGAKGGFIIRIRPADLADKTGYQSSAGRARPKLQRAAARNHACTLISEYELGHVCPPIDGLIPVATWNPVFAAFLVARNRPKYQTVAGRMTRIRSTDGRRVNATFVRH